MYLLGMGLDGAWRALGKRLESNWTVIFLFVVVPPVSLFAYPYPLGADLQAWRCDVDCMCIFSAAGALHTRLKKIGPSKNPAYGMHEGEAHKAVCRNLNYQRRTKRKHAEQQGRTRTRPASTVNTLTC